jgi:hypothetical protein
MAIEIKIVDFTDVQGTAVYNKTVKFKNKVKTVWACIKGFDLSYDDEAFKRKTTRINPSANVSKKFPYLVEVNLAYKCSNNSNNNQKGNVQILLFAEVE